MSYLLSQIAKITGGRLIGADHSVSVFLTDSRRIHQPAQSILIALKGIRHDGHDFIETAIAQGVVSFIVSDVFRSRADVSYILVEDSLRAFQQLAAAHRSSFTYPVIGITGSYGKTQIKDRLASVLRAKYNVVRSPRSYNSQTGVPLSIMAMSTEHDLGIFEAGISEVGEMAHLAAMIQPDIGLFTGLGAAHDEGFKDRKEKLEEKLNLFDSSAVIVYRRDDETVDQAIKKRFQSEGKVLFNWGMHESSELHILSKDAVVGGYEVTYCTGGGTQELFIKADSELNLTNGMHILAILHVLGCSQEEIVRWLGSQDRTDHGSHVEATQYGKGMLTDIGAIDGPTLRTARERLDSLIAHKGIQVILIDTGSSPLANDRRVAELVQELQELNVYCIGENLNELAQKVEARHYTDVQEFIEQSEFLLPPEGAILLQGPWSPELVALRSHLQQKGHQTQVTVNLQALVQNLNVYRSKLPAETKVMAMVKAFAYGSGDAEVARILQYHNVDYLAVAYADEGIALRAHGVELPIMVMNSSIHEFADLVRNRLEPEIYSLEMLEAFHSYASTIGLKRYPIHLKFDTGMHRLGFDPDQKEAVASLLSKGDALYIRSIFSHLFASDSEEEQLSLDQIKCFEEIRGYFKSSLSYEVLYHILNSAGITRFPQATMDMVRIGIGLYGYTGDPSFAPRLLPVIAWSTVISQVKEVKAGDTVGYGGIFRLTADMRIAILPVGYADGISRQLGNGVGRVMVHGVACPYVGNICMDMSMVDVTGIDCSSGDDVELIGPSITVDALAKACGTIGYEVLTSIPPRVKRQYVFLG